MKKIILFFPLVLSFSIGFSQSSSSEFMGGISLFYTISALSIILFILSIIIIQHLVFQSKIKKMKLENSKKVTEIVNFCDHKISESEAEMLKTLNASIGEIQRDYMNKVVQIRSDIESHQLKIISLMESNQEMKEFYDVILKEHFNPILQKLR